MTLRQDLMKFSSNSLRTGDIIAVKGKGLIAALIRLVTGSEYTHVAMVYRVVKGRVWIAEIDYKSSFTIRRLNYDKFTAYRPRFAFKARLLKGQVLKFIGVKYDFLDVLRLLFKIDRRTEGHLICSEAVQELFLGCGVRLTEKNIPSPREIVESQKLKKIGEV